MHNINWHDLRFVLAVANEGSAAAAARVLHVNHSTVVRRIHSFETHLNIRIFDRLASGYRLTASGEVFLDAAQSIDSVVADLGRKIIEQEDGLQGEVRVTTTDSIFVALQDDIVKMRQAQPQVVVDLVVSNYHVDLDGREADIAIRPTMQPPAQLRGRRICSLGFGIYAATALIGSEKNPNLRHYPWIGLGSPISESPLGRWLRESLTIGQTELQCNSFTGLMALAEQGAGCTLLPCWMGDHSHLLRRVVPNLLPFRNDLWLLYHADVAKSLRVKAVADFLFDAIHAKKALLEGRSHVD